ncbi:MAG: hypothetical protein H7301_11660 [Cryobacterium sp.]|nr:hypothetical protein [Oligoflexia bacterium]
MMAKEIFKLGLLLASYSSLVTGAAFAKSKPSYPSRSPIPASIFIKNAEKRTACFTTINSSDEKEAFITALNPRDWDLVELTGLDSSGDQTLWFDDACRKNIQCDINVISGHFAGEFFGSSGFRLTLDDLENHSCAEDCSGILRHPREVYLLGCNTLATRDGDHRTQQQYYDVLVQDGYTPEDARRVSEDRYGVFGQWNKSKMERAFIGIPYLYGFSSTSQKGNVQGPRIRDYLSKIGDYTAHFDQIVSEKTNAISKPNQILKVSIQSEDFIQCRGLDPSDPNYSVHLDICSLFDRKKPMADRLALAEKMFRGDQLLMLLPSIQNFLKQNARIIHRDYASLFSRLSESSNARKTIMDAIESVKMSETRLEWMRFAQTMGWISREELVHSIHERVASAFAADSMTVNTADSLCSIGAHGVNELNFSDVVGRIRNFHFANESIANALRCIGIARYPEFREKLADFFRSHPENTVNNAIVLATIFSESTPTLHPTTIDLELLKRLTALCKLSMNSSNQLSCDQALARLGSTDEGTAHLLAQRFKAVSQWSTALTADALRFLTVGSQELEDVLLNIYRDPKNELPNGLERYFFFKPIQKIENQKLLLSDLANHGPERRPDEMVYSLRNMHLSPSELENFLKALKGKPNILQTARVLIGFLYLAQNSDVGSSFLEKLFSQYRFVNIATDEQLQAFYEAIKLPLIRSTLESSPQARKDACLILGSASNNLGFDDDGDAVPQKFLVKTCSDLGIN